MRSPKGIAEAMLAKQPQKEIGFAVVDQNGTLYMSTTSETKLGAMTAYLFPPPFPVDVPAAFDVTGAHVVRVSVTVK